MISEALVCGAARGDDKNKIAIVVRHPAQRLENIEEFVPGDRVLPDGNFVLVPMCGYVDAQRDLLPSVTIVVGVDARDELANAAQLGTGCCDKRGDLVPDETAGLHQRGRLGAMLKKIHGVWCFNDEEPESSASCGH